MRQFNFISIKLSFFLIIGIVIGFYFEPNLKLSFIVLSILILFLGIALKKQTRNAFPIFGIIASLITLLLGVILTGLSNPKNKPSNYSHQLKKAKNDWSVWVVKVDEVLKTSAYTQNYIVKAKSLNKTEVTGKLLLRISRDSLDNTLLVDDEIIFSATAKTISKALNPHQFNYRDYLKKRGINHYLQTTTNTLIKKSNPTKTVFGYAANYRQTLIKKLKKKNFGIEELGVIQALLLGQRNQISEQTYDDYKNAGAVHILAVSGLHIGILLLLLQFLLKPLEFLPKGKTIKLIVIIALLWAFAFIAGLSASIVRAVTMFCFVAYAMYLNRPTNTFNVIALSLFFILLIKPLFLFQVGFQMSYLAVIAIVWIYPKLQQFWYPKHILLRKAWQLVTVSGAAQLGVLPISLFYFHQFPSLFFISNLIVIPFMAIILGTGILVLLLASLNSLPDLLVVSYNFLINCMNTIIAFVGRQEAFVFKAISFDAVQLVIGYALVIGLVVTLSRPRFKNLVFFIVGIITFQGWVLFKTFNTSSKSELLLSHEVANTMLLKQEGNHLTVYGKTTGYSESLINDYVTAERIDKIKLATLKNSYTINTSKLILIDSLGIQPNTKVDYLVLTQSPKVNLERLLDALQPKIVIADGSNYKSYIARWKNSCSKRKLPFHYTGEKGAYYFQ